MKYSITFDDGVIYTSPDILQKDPGWASEDGEKLVGIREINIKLPFGKRLVLRGFEKYNFFVEAAQALGVNNNAKIESFFFCGAWKGYAVLWKIDIKHNKIIKTMTKDGKEYNGTATRGWRIGLIGEKAESGICHL